MPPRGFARIAMTRRAPRWDGSLRPAPLGVPRFAFTVATGVRIPKASRVIPRSPCPWPSVSPVGPSGCHCAVRSTQGIDKAVSSNANPGAHTSGIFNYFSEPFLFASFVSSHCAVPIMGAPTSSSFAAKTSARCDSHSHLPALSQCINGRMKNTPTNRQMPNITKAASQVPGRDNQNCFPRTFGRVRRSYLLTSSRGTQQSSSPNSRTMYLASIR